MTKDIVSKLRVHLSKPVDTECAVVYLLAEVRKLLENERPDPKPYALWMFCHWALHVNLTQSATTSNLLERIDRFVLKNVAGFHDDGTFAVSDEESLKREFVFLDTFRQELRDFLNEYRLPVELSDADKHWFNFLAAYAGVIEDGELSAAKGKSALRAIEKVTFSKGPALSETNHVPFSIHWDILLQDGRLLKSHAETLRGQQIFFKLSLA
jgi:hypothetical protein